MRTGRWNQNPGAVKTPERPHLIDLFGCALRRRMPWQGADRDWIPRPHCSGMGRGQRPVPGRSLY